MTMSWPTSEDDTSSSVEDTLRYLNGRLEYAVRVRGATPPGTFLWGSAGLTTDLTFNAPVLLHVGNDRYGQVISLGTQVADGTQTPLGTLQPGEVVSLSMQTVMPTGGIGVYATCAGESIVRCVISPHGGTS
jgi:hypothetical protein